MLWRSTHLSDKRRATQVFPICDGSTSQGHSHPFQEDLAGFAAADLKWTSSTRASFLARPRLGSVAVGEDSATSTPTLMASVGILGTGVTTRTTTSRSAGVPGAPRRWDPPPQRNLLPAALVAARSLAGGCPFAGFVPGRPRPLRLRPRRLRPPRRHRGPRPARLSASGIDGSRHPGGQRDLVKRNWSPMSRYGDLDLDRTQDVLGHSLDREAEHELIEDPPLRTPSGVTDGVGVHIGADGDVGTDPDEVEVDRVATGGVALHLAGPKVSWSSPAKAEPDQGVWRRGRDVESPHGTGP